MPLTLELPDELADTLTGNAAKLGLSVPDYALQLLSSVTPSNSSPKSGADLVAYWQREKLIGTRGDIVDSQLEARTLRERAERRGE